MFFEKETSICSVISIGKRSKEIGKRNESEEENLDLEAVRDCEHTSVPGDTVIKFSLQTDRHDPTKGIGSLDSTVSIPELDRIHPQLDMTNINVLNMFLVSRGRDSVVGEL